MADHGAPEYATATGNDYSEHEGTYKFFTKLTTVGTIASVCVVIALAIGGVNGYWSVFTIGILATLVATAIGLASESGKPALTGGVLVLLLIALVLTS